MMTRIASVILVCAVAGALSGCGIRGDLERPAPIWGPDQRTQGEREHEMPDGPVDPGESPRDDSAEERDAGEP